MSILRQESLSFDTVKLFQCIDALVAICSFLPSKAIICPDGPCGLLRCSRATAEVGFSAEFWRRLTSVMDDTLIPHEFAPARVIAQAYDAQFGGHWVIDVTNKYFANSLGSLVSCVGPSYSSYPVRWSQELVHGKSNWEFIVEDIYDNSDVFVGLSGKGVFKADVFSFNNFMLAGWSYTGGTVTAIPRMRKGDRIGVEI
eukprot:TRINITY_DN9091_c0_g1_i1.p1 TRINITY_DN9091_c0_g1~~TRINITY_DN9091_c0_g1_i1.p1  ORF type:complete len:206 (-),score=28.51 TRINITY_DN9091_c0_g1_i1:472-1068(-)